MKLCHKIIFSTAIICCTFINAAENATQLYVDLNASTPALDSLYAPQQDSLFTTGFYVSNVENLYGYEFYIQYDTTKLRYMSSAKGTTSAPNFMELKGESINSQIRPTINSKDKILIAGYYLGAITGANGSGYLGVVTFCKLTADSTTITLSNPKFITPSDNDITINTLHNSLLLPPGSISINRRKQYIANNDIQIINKKVHCTLPFKSSAQIRLFNVAGRCIFERNDLSRQITFDIPQTCSGVFILTIAYQNGTYVYPVTLK